MKKHFSLPLLLLSAIVLTIALLGCTGFSKNVGEIPVTAVTVPKTEVSLNTVADNEYNSYQIYPTIYPDNATNKNVVFYYADIYDSEFLTISSTGKITALKEKLVENKIKTIEIVVASAENTDIKASVFVTIENVAAKEVYFEPSNKEVRLDSKPFFVKPLCVHLTHRWVLTLHTVQTITIF